MFLLTLILIYLIPKILENALLNNFYSKIMSTILLMYSDKISGMINDQKRFLNKNQGLVVMG